MINASGPWNSLEVVKVSVSALTPVLVATLTVVVAAANKRREQAEERLEWVTRRAVDRLLELHKEMAPLLNDLL